MTPDDAIARLAAACACLPFPARLVVWNRGLAAIAAIAARGAALRVNIPVPGAVTVGGGVRIPTGETNTTI